MNQQDPYCFRISTSMNRNIKSVSETVKRKIEFLARAPDFRDEPECFSFFAMLVFFHVQNYVSVASAHDKEL